MRTRAYVYILADGGMPFERKMTLPFPPFPGLRLFIVVGPSIIGFRVSYVEWHEGTGFEDKRLTVIFLEPINGKLDLNREDFKGDRKWVENPSVVWPRERV